MTDWLSFPRHKPKNITHCLVTMSYFGADGTLVTIVVSAIYVNGDFKQLSWKGDKMVRLQDLGMRGIRIHGFVPYPPPMPIEDYNLLG